LTTTFLADWVAEGVEMMAMSRKTFVPESKFPSLKNLQTFKSGEIFEVPIFSHSEGV
jgi:hypothetical protein